VSIETEGAPLSAGRVPAAEVLAGLNQLLQLEHDAVAGYTTAIERLENQEHVLRIQEFRLDHERHIRELNDLILAMGGTPVNEPHATLPLKQAVQKLAGAGGDKALLIAWRANELQVVSRYRESVRRAAHWPAEATELVGRNAADEERHYQWVADLLSGGETPEIEMVERVREIGGMAKEKLTVAATQARQRAAEGLDEAADRMERFSEREQSAEGIRGRAADGAHRIAGGLESTAAYLRRPAPPGSAGGVRETLEEEIRRNPGRSLLVTLVVGFVLGRALR
jgi:rubrerythrin